MTGKVKFFNKEKGFGFIVSDEDLKDVFFHITRVINHIELDQDQAVIFDTEVTDRGINAINVARM